MSIRKALDQTGWEIAICQYNALGEPPSEWFDYEGSPLPEYQDEYGDLKPPAEWNGQPISRYDGEYIVGDLIVMGEGYVANIEAPTNEFIIEALCFIGWDKNSSVMDIQAFCCRE